MADPRCTIALQRKGSLFKLAKIWFGSDGSYYVSCPYHRENKAIAALLTVNYALDAMDFRLEEAIDVADLEDPNKRLKLSHHPDGFVQFSGSGIVSGKERDGTIKGVGVMSWPLSQPVPGPAFGLRISKIHEFQQLSGTDRETVIFFDQALNPDPKHDALTIEGYYFTAIYQRFIRHSNGEPWITLIHPSSTVLTLRVLLPSPNAQLQGFIGLDAYWDPPDEDFTAPTFALTASTGNIRFNEKNQKLGDMPMCVFPSFDLSGRRPLNYRPDDSERQ